MSEQSKPKSGFADPLAHAAMIAAEEAKLQDLSDTLASLSRELTEYFTIRTQTHNLRPQQAVVALIEAAARAAVIAATMSRNYNHNLEQYLNFFANVTVASEEVIRNDPIGQLVNKIFGGNPKCSNESFSAEQPSSSSTPSPDSPSPSSGDSNND